MRIPDTVTDGRWAAGCLAARLAVSVVVLPYALDWRAPFLASVRVSALVGFIAVAIAIIIAEFVALNRLQRAGASSPVRRAIGVLSLALAMATLASMVMLEGRFLWTRHIVLRADPAMLETLGRHVMVGYRDMDEILALIDRRAVAGVFITGRNVRGRSEADIRRDITTMQKRRRQQGLPPLLIATDQEGGVVSRVSPPLPRLPPLSEIAAGASSPDERRKAVQDYADTQGRGLAALGITVNFAPVVDLNFGIVTPGDTLTRIHTRAISADPAIVRDVADPYCSQLAVHHVRCTLKHFPGLGRVRGDTHLEEADLAAPLGELSDTDWLPFRSMMRRTDLLVMLSHVRLTAIDPVHPVSFSRAVVHDLLRTEWAYDGLLITDDVSMGAVTRSPEGIPGASVAALNAGVDLILVSYDVDQFYVVMAALLRADRAKGLAEDMMRESRRRLERSPP